MTTVHVSEATVPPTNSPDTPYLAVDLAVMQSNLARAAAAASARGIALRPHAKTHKVPQLGRLQIDHGAIGLTLATVGEAEVFAGAGLTDLFIAFPLWPSPSRAARLRAVAERATLRIGVDSVETARLLGAALGGSGISVLVEVDSGHHRSGVRPADAASVALAASEAGLTVDGVFTFPGHSYAPGARTTAAGDEAKAITIAADALEGAGFRELIRSGGSTPSFSETDGTALTEARPGVYVFNDAQQVELGSCSFEDVALTAMATVVSRSGRQLILDAGSKVLGADRAAWASGYGRLPEFPGAQIVALSEHHATVTIPDEIPVPDRGSILRVIPNHVCSAVNLANELFIIQEGAVIDAWRVAARGANS